MFFTGFYNGFDAKTDGDFGFKVKYSSCERNYLNTGVELVVNKQKSFTKYLKPNSFILHRLPLVEPHTNKLFQEKSFQQKIHFLFNKKQELSLLF